MAPPKNKQHEIQPTSAGTNLPASEPEAVSAPVDAGTSDAGTTVGNMTIETDLEDNRDSEQESANSFDRLAMRIASVASEFGRPITDVRMAAVNWIPEDKESAQAYAGAFRRMHSILEVLSSEVTAVVNTRFGT